MSSEQTTPALYEKPMVYQLTNGDEMRLTINMVKQFLVRGNASLVTGQEIMFFMQICKARQLNPFINDCYLVKYGSDPAAIIVSVDYFRKNARRARDCKGWAAGIIVMTSDNVVRYSKGLVLPGEKLIGGWFRAQPEGWSEPFEHEVPLEAFIKRKRDGSVTQFWEPAKQPFMIRKVAECQGLRFLWGENTAGMYAPEEIVSDPSDIEIKHIDTAAGRPGNMYEATQKAPETKTEEPNRREPYTEWQKGEDHGTDASGDTGSSNADGDSGHRGSAGDTPPETPKESAPEQPEQESPPEGDPEVPELTEAQIEAVEFCKDEDIRKAYKSMVRKMVIMAADALGFDYDEKNLADVHQRIKDYFSSGDEIPPASESRPDGSPDSSDDPAIMIDLLDKFNTAFADAQQDPQRLMPIFKAAVNAANIPTGKRPDSELQARTFLSSWENLLKTDKQAAGLSKGAKGAEVEQDDKDKTWDTLWDFMHTNYPHIDFHMFKNFLAIRSAHAGVPVDELAKEIFTSDEHCRGTMTKFNEWRNVDKY